MKTIYIYIFIFILLGAVVSSTTSIETAPTSTHQHTSNATNQVFSTLEKLHLWNIKIWQSFFFYFVIYQKLKERKQKNKQLAKFLKSLTLKTSLQPSCFQKVWKIFLSWPLKFSIYRIIIHLFLMIKNSP